MGTTGPLQRTVRVFPAYDKRAARPNGGYCGAQLVFILTDGRRAATFAVSTDWDLPSARPGMYRFDGRTFGSSICYHDTKPHPGNDAEGHRRDCEFTDGECYSAIARTDQRSLFEKLIAEGDAAVWAALQEVWDEYIEPKPEARAQCTPSARCSPS